MVVGDRKFHDFPTSGSSRSSEEASNPEVLAGTIRDSILGSTFRSPLRGVIPTLYCDWIASGRSLTFIEEFIHEHVLPSYGNTHTISTASSLQTSLFRHEARETFRNAVRASESDAVIFVGSGTTGAVHKLISALNLSPSDPPVVIASVKEHHSNLLPWRELNCKVRLVQETDCGCIHLPHLKEILEEETSNNQNGSKTLIGAFSAASNINRKNSMTISAPYTNIDMNPKVPLDTNRLCYKDAVYFSVHKFVGGTQTPGVLIAKKSLFQKKVPHCGGGGGSVFFVTEEDHVYLQDAEVREEGGTPPIVETIRAGLVMQLKQSMGNAYILRRERAIDKMVYSRLKTIPSLILLGDNKNRVRHTNTLPVYSFLIKSPLGTYLHHNFVTTLLNDLFGIQSRGGCACAGPYAQSLLGIPLELAKEYEKLLLEDSRLDREHLRRGQREYSSYEALRPGFTRLNFPWFFDDSTVEGILDALEFVVEHGWKFLVQYILNNETGEWKHHTNLVFKERKWLGNISYASGKFEYKPGKAELSVLNSKMDESSDAETILSNAIKAASRLQVPDQRLVFSEVDHLLWFTLPLRPRTCCGDECLSGSLDAGQKEGYSLCQKYLTQSFKTWLPKETIVQEDKVREEESLSSEVEKTVCITPRVDNETNGIEFDLGAVTVDPGSDAYDPRPLIPYLEELDIHYLYEKQNIMAAALEADCTSICSYCSRMKRGRIYAAARKEKYNVLAMGQHLDDLVESFIMSIFHNGRMRTMKANYSVKEKDLRKLPIIPENCPACFESPKERHRTKQLLAAQELLFPRLYWSLKSAMFPLMNIQATGIESKLFGGGNPETEEEEDEKLLDSLNLISYSYSTITFCSCYF
ncbi:unnamed protein product [Lepeophtheirus salmonis]|uniref:(salmon louse) hypothetical protein n=1 Tax=Lepeophtheirus salmonis TaxID=72036 RepID=A0A7R8CT82_LEPSM|nr:unnamed protein product [Lepeophtheirus salmonis]CAF2887963.1 unnamed protein product [Lepeophtheirus salmonis]